MRKPMHKTFASMTRPCALIASVLLATSIAFAQSQATTGNIESRVVDPNGGAVPGIKVTATNQGTAVAKSADTDSEGSYRILMLPPGKYKVTTGSTKGFAAATFENVEVTVGGRTPLDIKLSIGSANIIIDVATEGQIVETTRTAVSSTVNERAIQNLPVNGRNYLDFATLTPRVVPNPTRHGHVTAGGQKVTLNSLQVDGEDNTNTVVGP